MQQAKPCRVLVTEAFDWAVQPEAWNLRAHAVTSGPSSSVAQCVHHTYPVVLTPIHIGAPSNASSVQHMSGLDLHGHGLCMQARHVIDC